MLKKLLAKICPKKKRTPDVHPGLTSAPVIYKNRPKVRIAGMDISAYGADVGILIVNCPGAIIEHNRVRGGRTCIQVEDSPGVSVYANDLAGYANRPSINDLEEEPGHGIQFRSSSGTITGNTIDRRNLKTLKAGPGEDGINIHGKESRATITANIIIGAAQPSGNPITIDLYAMRCHVNANTINSAGPRGIVFAYGAGHHCKNNSFNGGCHDAAVAVDRECYPTIEVDGKQIPTPPIGVDIQGSVLNGVKGSAQVWVNPDGTEARRL